jgi:uncharacterized protein (TIGR00251 family)
MIEHIRNGILQVKVRPGMPKTEIAGWDETARSLRVNLHAKAEDNKANIELLKLLSRISKMKARIVSGARSREKTVRFS